MSAVKYLLVGLLLVGCGGGATPDGTVVDNDASADGNADSEAPVGCTGTQPSTMVTLAEGYSIDSTEVTRCQYQLWLDTAPSTSGQAPACISNVDFTPFNESNSEECWPPGTRGKEPVVCVDWCDAVAYCKAVGKRLCGKIGGGSNDPNDFADATRSQWFNACSSGGKFQYPYGDTYDNGTKCNDGNRKYGSGEMVSVGTLPECQSAVSGYAGVFDLSGNVWEWEDSCMGDNDQDNCQIRGGSVMSPEVWASCGYDMAAARLNTLDVVGFRCCSP
jgi:formylglycine-generating enzyme